MADERGVHGRAAFDFVRYGSVWEDADVLCEALAPVARDGRVLSIASAGDNALALLTLDPEEVVAVDLNPAQLACLELRKAAFMALDHAPLLAFLGVSPSAERARTYAGLRDAMPASARAFWDAHPDAIIRGAIHHGKFERYFAIFRRYVLPLVHGRATVRELLAPKSREERVAFYDRRWDTPRWRLLFRLFFSRAVMGRLGRDPAFFAQVEGAVGERILERSRRALTEFANDENPFCVAILTGNFSARALPRYLRPEWHDAIRSRIARVNARLGAVDELDTGLFGGMNLSDVFEYMDAAEAERVYRACAARCRPGARIAYWNMLVPRGRPASLAGAIEPLADLARSLHARDRAWFYGAFHIDEVRTAVAA